MRFEKIAPKKFLCRYSLKSGSVFVGICMLIISIICVISLSVELIFYKKCVDCTTLVLHNVYSFSINAIIYCAFMIVVNVWFIWGVKRHKATVVLSWVVIMGMWWAQASVLVFVLLCMNISDTTLGWMVAVACAIIAFIIFAYFLLVGYGHWLEIRKTSHISLPTDTAETVTS